MFINNNEKFKVYLNSKTEKDLWKKKLTGICMLFIEIEHCMERNV